MKTIIMSIRPQWVAKILNGEKTIEIRKKFPKDYVGWVYIYVTKDRKQCLVRNNINKTYHLDTCYWDEFESHLNGKVVARFWCDKVEEIENKPFTRYGYPRTKTLDSYNLAKYSCVDNCDIKEYLAGGNGTAIHITKLEIFDEPKELSEFWSIGKKCKFDNMVDREWYCEYCKKPDCIKPLNRAPQSWGWIEV